MKIHNNPFLKNLGPSADQVQKAYQAERAAKQIRTESEMAAKLRNIKELLDEAARKETAAGTRRIKDGKDPSSGESPGEKKPEEESRKAKGESKQEEEGSLPSGPHHIDIRA